MRINGARSIFRGRNIGEILPAVFWFVLLALVLTETLIVGFSNWQTTNAATRQGDDLSAPWVDGPWSLNMGANLPGLAPVRNSQDS
ncbi:MAG TPA: hypothetical protein VG168_12140 [Bryobacteraceae bacterium]|nr:hypothetical protein [Bryobacteraceae bacterium]